MNKKILASSALSALFVNASTPPPDMARSFQEICIENGFAVEEHSVTTEDGYVLGLFRIPGFKGD